MVFSSITFLFYFLPIVIVGYYCLSFSRALQNIWLFALSILFYGWGEPFYVILILGSICLNWVFGLLVGAFEKKKRHKKIVLIVACIANIGVLAIFKYTNFICDTINTILETEQFLKVSEISLPIGISFFTFQALSYVIDVYRGDAKPQKNPLNLGLYIAFFPQLIAGPIVRYNSIEEQILHRKASWTQVAEGCCRFVPGLIKKILISNNMATIADQVFELATAGSSVKAVPVLLAWLGAIAYTLQLYYDFSAYSDMAIGLGKMFGFEFEENFRYPFASKSIREFMSRWHISLSTWFHQYVYLPLGGSRVVNQDLMVRNLFIVWLLTGIWHGAAWTFVWWGLYFFVLILVEKVIMFESWEGHDIGKRIYTIVAVVIAMTLFRSESMWQFSQMLLNMTGLNQNGFYSAHVIMFLKEFWPVFVAGILCLFPTGDYIKQRLFAKKIHPVIKVGASFVYVAGMLVLFWICTVILAKGGYNPFIYFNF